MTMPVAVIIVISVNMTQVIMEWVLVTCKTISISINNTFYLFVCFTRLVIKENYKNPIIAYN